MTQFRRRHRVRRPKMFGGCRRRQRGGREKYDQEGLHGLFGLVPRVYHERLYNKLLAQGRIAPGVHV